MSRLLLTEPAAPDRETAVPPVTPISGGKAAPSRPPADGAATSFAQITQGVALELLRSEQMPIAHYLALCDERGWDRAWGLHG